MKKADSAEMLKRNPSDITIFEIQDNNPEPANNSHYIGYKKDYQGLITYYEVFMENGEMQLSPIQDLFEFLEKCEITLDRLKVKGKQRYERNRQ